MTQTPLPAYLSDAAAFIDIWMTHLFPTLNQPSVSLALAYKGTPVLQKAWGFANLETREKATPEHIYRVASHSKSFTAFLVAKLVDEGKLNFDQPIGTYLPWLAKNKVYAAMTLRHILSHSTGTQRDGTGGYWNYENPFPTRKEVRAYFTKTKPVLEPNTTFKYSNFAYGLIDAIVEEVCGQPYDTVMRENVLEPLKLASTGTDAPETKRKVATGYTHLEDGVRYPVAPFLPADGLAAATGFHSTPSNLTRVFSACLLDKGLLSRKVQKDLMHPVWPINSKTNSATWYCLGLTQIQYLNRTYYQHSGGYLGFTSRTTLEPTTGICISICMNANDAMTNALTWGVCEILNFFENERGVKNPLQKYETPCYSVWGSGYILAGKGELTFADLDGQHPLDNATKLLPQGKDTFTLKPADGYGAEGELATFHFKNSKPSTIQSGPTLMVTDRKAFQKKLQQISLK